VVHLACGFQHCVALTAEARVFIWGAAGFSHHTPVALNPASPPALPAERAVRAVAAGTNYSAAVLADGSALTWGQNRWAPRPPRTNAPPHQSRARPPHAPPALLLRAPTPAASCVQALGTGWAAGRGSHRQTRALGLQGVGRGQPTRRGGPAGSLRHLVRELPHRLHRPVMWRGTRQCRSISTCHKGDSEQSMRQYITRSSCPFASQSLTGADRAIAGRRAGNWLRMPGNRIARHTEGGMKSFTTIAQPGSLRLAVIAVGARAATVAVVDPAGRRHLELQDTAEMSDEAQQPRPEALGPEVDQSSSENVTPTVNRYG
jgi:hypothetical protein